MHGRMRIWLGAALVLAMIGGFLAGPAAAETTGVGHFGGSANVGKWFSTPCDKNGWGDPDGKGLYSVGTVTVAGISKGDDIRPEEGTWQISSDLGTFAGTTQSGPFAGEFELNVCGYLSATVDPDRSQRNSVGAIGASCETSKGHHGQGNILFANGERIKLFNFGWKAGAGGTLLAQGSYQEYAQDGADPNTAGAKKEKFGTLLGQMQFQGGFSCTGLNTPATNNSNGAQNFTMMGVVEFINGVAAPTKEENDPTEPIFGPKHCKGQGPDLPEPGTAKKPKTKNDARPCDPRQGGDKRG